MAGVRYYGYYSNKSRGLRKNSGKDNDVPALIETDLSLKEFRRNWARLIQKVYEVDPLICTKCRGEMKVISVIEDQAVIRKILKHLGLFVTESSIHNSEYMPYFRRTRELVNQYTHEKMWGVGKTYGMTFKERMVYIQKFLDSSSKKNKLLAYGDEEIEIEASQEYFSHILNSLETNEPYVFNGNIPNTGLISNLPDGSVVEVPIMVDGCGLHPCHIGDLPPGLAVLNRTNLNVQELAVKGFIDKNRELIYQAVQLDPLTSSVLPLPEIRKMVDELFKAHEKYHTI